MKIFAIIPAAGKSSRIGFSVPKQFLKFGGKEVIAYTLEVFQKNKNINGIIIPAEPEYFRLLNRIKKKYKLTKVLKILKGGNERQDSVYYALKVLEAKKDDLVVVHDAARPLLPAEVLNRAINLAKLKGNALVCVKAGDTLIKADDAVKNYIDRKNVYYVQTPQIFKYSQLIRAAEKAYESNFYGTDESMLVKKLGKKVYLSEGSPLNFKITTKSDLHLFSMIIAKF
ncbi:MAG TPA: 2-C-methyl-D-erythritol 4-phosphate cytidylyltransferase [Ignavibacteriaceae bacterium]|nr:2-C-methyl-D-erythritol 4-phosphate cytidylyltransferase [Ignavibacteriaceae bacterium]